MIKKMYGSRKVLRFISLLCVITFGLMTIVGTGGGGGGNGQPETTPDPGTVEKTANVNTSEIGGTELNVLSVYEQTGSNVVNGSFSTLVSTVGTQLLFIADQQNNLRGITLSTIDAVTNQANILDADATSTALSILMLTPGITTVDPTETQTRISELQNLGYFQNLVDFLRTDLLNRTLPDVLGDEEFNTILEGCINEWLNTYSSGSTQNLFGIQPASIDIDPTNASFNINLKDDSDMENVLLTMSNFGWRFVNVFRRDLDMSSNEIQVLTLFDGLFNSMDGAVPISWGSLFTNTIGDPEIADDPYPVDLSSSSDIQKVQYWVVGPGSASSSDSLPPSLDTVDDASALIDVYGTTLMRYFVFPILDIITGTSSILTDSAKWSKAREVWSGIKGGLSLYGLIQGDDEASAIRELINISASLFSILITSGVLVSAGIISAKAGIVIGIVLGASAIIMGAGNLILVVKNIFSYPRVAALEVTNSITDYPDTVIQTISVGDNPIGVAVTPNGNYAYVTNQYDDTVSVIQTSNNTVIDTISVGDGSTLVAVTPNGSYAYVTNQWDDTVSVIQTSNNTVIDTISVGDNPGGVAVTPNGNYAYVTNWDDDTVSVIQTSNNTVIDTISVGDHPGGVAVTPNGNYAYVTNQWDDTVSVIQTSNNTVIDTISVGDHPGGVAVTPNGNYAYVTNQWDDTVSVIQTSNNTVIDTISVGDGSTLVAVTPNGNYAYVTNEHDDTVSVIQTSNNTVIDTISVGDHPIGVAVTPNGNYAYVTNQWDDTVSVIQTSNNTVIDTISVGDGSTLVAVTPNGSYVYVTNSHDDTVSVIGY